MDFSAQYRVEGEACNAFCDEKSLSRNIHKWWYVYRWFCKV